MAGKKELTRKRDEVQVPEGVERIHNRRVFVPPTDIFQQDEALVLVTDMPGVDQKSLEVTLEKRVLTIRGTAQTAQPEGYSLAYGEYEPGDYERAFTICEEIDTDRIEANVKNGVLTLVLPKAGPSQRKIEVKVA